ncbi:ER membrane protein complex subunit 1 isoform X2 [Nilaparvata lugens]|uniref:ER membrane protein complex subunit 1 isoform X2 n=1 Tax=Nilaparvata lugens TaxID=108931 RepID=UPI00193E4D5A|nr:ER membrane protein complex subunit 1 isoform X2 [Nilaparvata lugens]
MYADSEVITVSGNGPFIVRGWNLANGYSHFEWISFNDADEPHEDVLWTYHHGKLYKVVMLDSQQVARIISYNVRSGGQLAAYTINIPGFSRKCKAIGINLVCLSDNGELKGVTVINSQFFNLDVSAETKGASCKLLDVDSSADLPVLAIGCKLTKLLVAIKDNTFKALSETVPISAGVSVTQHVSGTHLVVLSKQVDGVIKVSGKVLETDQPVDDILSSFESTSPLSDVESSNTLCTLRRDRSVSCQMLLSTVDHSILLAQTSSKILWSREEALANIISVELVDLPVSDIEAAIEKEFDNKEGGFVGMFVRRLMSQLLQLKSLLMSVVSLGEAVEKDGLDVDLVRDEFGLHKLIVAVTSVGKLFGIDNISGNIVWQKYLGEMETYSSIEKPVVSFYVQRTSRHLPHPAQCFILGKHKDSDESMVYTFNPINGQPIGDGLHRLGYRAVQSLLLHFVDEQFLKGVVLLDSKGGLHVLPQSQTGLVAEHAKSIFFFTANSQSGLLVGYTLAHTTSQKLVASEVWRIQLSHKITGLMSKSPLEKVHSQGRVLGDRSVLYKYINPNLVAVMTQAEDPIHKNVLSIYLIDVVSGSIVFSIVHKRATEPIHLVHSENWIVYTYFSDKSRRTEIGALELYEGKTQSNTTAFSSVSASDNPIVERQAFILPAGIEAMKETITEKGITSKHILVGLNSGGILEIPWMFLDPRRPLGDIREEGVIPYMPELPLPAESIINYNQTLHRVRAIHTAPSGLESTCLVFIYGLDLFYTRVAPSKTFDVLKEDFDYLLITAVLVGLSVAAYATKRLAQRKALKQAWK